MRRYIAMGELMADNFSPKELNSIICRYLREECYVFGYEGQAESTIDGFLIPDGTLVRLVGKGLQRLQFEANGGKDMADMVSFKPMELIRNDMNELKQIVKNKKKRIRNEEARGMEPVQENKRATPDKKGKDDDGDKKRSGGSNGGEASQPSKRRRLVKSSEIKKNRS